METAEQYFSRVRAENRRRMEKNRAEAFARCPELEALENEKAQLFLTHNAEALRALQQKQKVLLDSLGLPADALSMPYTCPLCRDTGYIGETVKQKCACRLRREQLLYRAEARINENETLETFRTDIYPTAEQRARSEKIKGICETYAASLPRPEKPQLILLGMTGLGKSFFGNAIAARAADRGIESRRITAYGFIHEVIESFSSGADPVAVYARVPLLVLDDLGTEPMLQNVTENALFSLVDQRLSAGLATVYITNLSPDELKERFRERIASRIFQKDRSSVIRFTGESLRGL